MKKLKKIGKWILGLAIVGHIGICCYMYFAQESLIFHPEKLSKNVRLKFGHQTKEGFIDAEKGIKLSTVLCKTDSVSKGLIFFLHGNTGNLEDQEDAARFYNTLGYDFFTMDYRGFGKSGGEITSEEQFFNDIDQAYESILKDYTPEKTIVIGYSVGTASAAMIASRKNPAGLVLIAPYYSLVDMTHRRYPFLPSFLLKYRFETNEFVKKTSSPILLVHGDKDDVLPFDGSQMLSKLLKKGDLFLPVKGQDHNHFEECKEYKQSLLTFLSASLQ
jgi:pimeloyl-ACP methyl ester carboxylesterase